MADATKKKSPRKSPKPKRPSKELAGLDLVAMNYYLSGMTPQQVAAETGMTTWKFRQMRQSPAGRAYLATVYEEVVDMRRDMVAQALTVIKTNMSDIDPALRQRAAETVIKNLGTRPDGNLDDAGTTQTAKLSATEIARAIVSEMKPQPKQVEGTHESSTS